METAVLIFPETLLTWKRFLGRLDVLSIANSVELDMVDGGCVVSRLDFPVLKLCGPTSS